MLLQHFVLSYLFFILFTSCSVNCRIFKRSIIEEAFKSENAEHYLESGGGDNNDHDVVKIFTDKSTNDSQLELNFKAFNETVTVKLQLHEEEYFITENTPVWLKRGRYEFQKADDFAVRNSLKAYSSADGSCFVITDVLKMTGEIKINGVIGNLAIQSLPSPVHNRLKRAERSINEHDYYSEYLNDNFISTEFHIVHYRNPSEKNLTYTDIIGDETKFGGRIKRELSEVPEIIYPRILLVTHCHYDSFRSIRDPEIDNFILYLLTYWATVDMKFRSFESPTIRLHISGIIIEPKYRNSPIIMKSVLREDYRLPVDKKGVDILKMNTKMKLYYGDPVTNPELLPIFEEAPSNVVFAMVGLLLYQSLTDEDWYQPVNGLTITVEKCKRLSETVPWSIALYSTIQHWGFQYEGLLTAAHEMGHVLGACHDDKSCGSKEKRNVMFVNGAGLNISKTSNEWSRCSIKKIREATEKRRGSSCMNFTEKPRGKRMCIPLPGQSISLNKQCQSKEMEKSCKPGKKRLKNSRRKMNKRTSTRGSYSADCHLYCRQETHRKNRGGHSYDCIDFGLVLDGAKCKPDHHCINGKCIPMPPEMDETEDISGKSSEEKSLQSKTSEGMQVKIEEIGKDLQQDLPSSVISQ